MSNLKVSGPIPSSVWASAPDLASLRGKSIFVTGGSGGLGAALVTKCAGAGAYVTFVDVKESMGRDLATRLNEEGLKAQFIRADVTNWTELTGAFRSAVRFSPTGNTLDHVIINAALFEPPLFTGFDEPWEDLDAEPPQPEVGSIDVNVKGTVFTLRLAQLYMGMKLSTWQAGSKSIIIVLSPSSHWTLPGFVTYGAAKFGTRGLFRGSREMLACKGIRMNGLTPSLMDTPQLANVGDTLKSVSVEFVPVDLHVTLAMHLLVNKSIVGRSIAVSHRLGGEIVTDPEELYVDLEDDEMGYDGSKKWWELAQKAAPRGHGTPEEFIRQFFSNLHKGLGLILMPVLRGSNLRELEINKFPSVISYNSFIKL